MRLFLLRDNAGLFIFVVLAGIVGATIYSVSVGMTSVVSISGCDPTGGNEDTYMAFCQNQGYGNYEHGAVYFGLEGGVTRNLRKAEVLFSGNSRLNRAFSTEATVEFFTRKKTKFYSIGFGYNEQSRFFIEVVKKLKLMPKVVVVNVDPYFYPYISSEAEKTLNRDLNFYFELLIKKTYQIIHGYYCRDVQLAEGAFCGKDRAIFRSRSDGRWTNYHVHETGKPAPVIYATERPDLDLEKMASGLKIFLSEVTVRPECLILTHLPFGEEFNYEPVLRELSSRFKVRSVLFKPKGISTWDRSHLALESAERWSAGFLEKAASIIADCTGKP